MHRHGLSLGLRHGLKLKLSHRLGLGLQLRHGLKLQLSHRLCLWLQLGHVHRLGLGLGFKLKHGLKLSRFSLGLKLRHGLKLSKLRLGHNLGHRLHRGLWRCFRNSLVFRRRFGVCQRCGDRVCVRRNGCRSLAHQVHHLQQLLVIIQDPLEEGVVETAELHTLIDQECLDVVAQFAQMSQPRHAGAALQGVQVALQALERLAVVAVVAPVVDALVDGDQQIRRLLEEDSQHFRINLLQLARDACAQRFGFHAGGRRLGNGQLLLWPCSEHGQRVHEWRVHLGLLAGSKAIERVEEGLDAGLQQVQIACHRTVCALGRREQHTGEGGHARHLQLLAALADVAQLGHQCLVAGAGLLPCPPGIEQIAGVEEALERLFEETGEARLGLRYGLRGFCLCVQCESLVPQGCSAREQSAAGEHAAGDVALEQRAEPQENRALGLVQIARGSAGRSDRGVDGVEQPAQLFQACRV